MVHFLVMRYVVQCHVPRARAHLATGASWLSLQRTVSWRAGVPAVSWTPLCMHTKPASQHLDKHTQQAAVLGTGAQLGAQPALASTLQG